jgi:glyoxalase superfamily protein/ClpA/ClpB-like protein
MRDFRNAKAMAQTLRASLSKKGTNITISQSLELVAEMFGLIDWNTLAAAIRAREEKVVEGKNDFSLPPVAPVGGPELPISTSLAATLQRASGFAAQRKHEYATLEHLLLALLDDPDASTALRAWKADLSALKGKITHYLDDQLSTLVTDNGRDPKPGAAFQRVLQRAKRRPQEMDSAGVTGADILEAICVETDSQAARLLSEQKIDISKLMARGKGWHYVRQMLEKYRPKGNIG